MKHFCSKIKCYNTWQHWVIAYHQSDFNDIVTGRKARNRLGLLEKLKDIIGEATPSFRIEESFKLEPRLTGDLMEELGKKRALDYVWKVLHTAWKNLEFVHLPTHHVYHSMDRTLSYIRGGNLPYFAKGFNKRQDYRLTPHMKLFCEAVFMNFGITSNKSNTLFRTNFKHRNIENAPLEWFVMEVWKHYFVDADPDDDNNMRDFDGEHYFRLPLSPLVRNSPVVLCQDSSPEDVGTRNIYHDLAEAPTHTLFGSKSEFIRKCAGNE